jgi:hypothetical protein
LLADTNKVIVVTFDAKETQLAFVVKTSAGAIIPNASISINGLSLTSGTEPNSFQGFPGFYFANVEANLYSNFSGYVLLSPGYVKTIVLDEAEYDCTLTVNAKSNGLPASDVKLNIGTQQGFTNAFGECIFILSAGYYTLLSEHAKYTNTSTAMSLYNNLAHTLVLTQVSFLIKFIVYDEDGSNLAGADLLITMPSGKQIAGVTNGSGQFEAYLEGGVSTISVAYEEHETYTRTVNVNTDKTVIISLGLMMYEVNLAFKKPNGSAFANFVCTINGETYTANALGIVQYIGPAGTYTISADADDAPWTTTFQLPGADQTLSVYQGFNYTFNFTLPSGVQ